MANIKANIKSHKKDVIRHVYNKQYKSSVKTALKKAIAAKEQNDLALLKDAVSNANKLLNRGENKNIIHKNKVARYKRRLALMINELESNSKGVSK